MGTFAVWLRSAGASKLAIVKIIKDVTGLGLKEAKELVDGAPNLVKDGLSFADAQTLRILLSDAGADVEVKAISPEPQAPNPEPGGVTYTVTLKSAGASKLAIVKIIKDVTGLGLKEAKELVDGAPNVVKDGLSQADAEALRKLLSDAGADVTVTASAGPAVPTPQPDPDPSTYSVLLRSAGASKLVIVKLVKDVTGLGLKEAKELVDSAPNVVKAGLSQAGAETLGTLLSDAGADITITQP